MKAKARIFFDLLLMAFFLAVIIASYQYNVKARLMPLVIAFPCLAMIAYQFIGDVRGKKEKKVISLEDEMFLKTMEKVHVDVMEEKKEKKSDREEVMGLLKSAAWVMLYCLMVYLFGFLITIPVYTIVFMRYSEDSWTVTLSTAFGLWLTIYLVFTVIAKISLYDALIFRLLGNE
jgi:hypothetical protein